MTVLLATLDARHVALSASVVDLHGDAVRLWVEADGGAVRLDLSSEQLRQVALVLYRAAWPG